MDSDALSRRLKQPGHDRTFLDSEQNFVIAAKASLDPEKYEVEANPKDLAGIFLPEDGGRSLGVRPEAKITSKMTGRRLFVEVKKQGPQGNAEERAMKHHTVQFYKTLSEYCGYEYHPYITIFCESLAVVPRYTTKFRYLIEPDNYFLWVDYDRKSICEYLNRVCAKWLD